MFRFTIRELVLVTVVVALGVAWWHERLKNDPSGWKHRALAALLAMRSEGWEVDWDGADTVFRRGDKVLTCPVRKDGRYLLRIDREPRVAASTTGKAKGPYEQSPPPWLSP